MRVCALSVILCFLCGGTLAGDSRAVIDTDFGTASKNADPDGKAERVSGVLPDGWHDNSSWAQVWVNYQPAEEDGRKFLRVNVTRAESGACQFAFILSKQANDVYCRLSFAMRSRTGAAVRLGIRQAGAPYDFLWDTSPSLRAAWQERQFTFRLDKRPEQIGLWFVVSGTGELDIARLNLVTLTPEELQNELRADHANGPKNLLRITRLPLGLQSGWSLSRELSDGDDVDIAADQDAVGPSGCPALRISRAKSLFQVSVPILMENAAAAPVELYSQPFAVPLAFDVHTASLHVKGEGRGKLAVVCDGRTLAAAQFECSGAWKRVAVPFRPLPLARAYGLRIETRGRCWIDALQVEKGDKPTEYAPQMACEVALACDSPIRVQFEDEEAVAQYCVSGYAGGALLRCKIVNAYGQEVLLPATKLSDAFLNRGKLNYAVFPSHPYGAYRIEAWVEKDDGERISPYNELVVYRLRKPRYWKKDAPDSPFGTHTLSVTRHILMAKAVGINWVRLHDAGTEYIGWYHLERKPGEWTFQDREIQRYRQHHMKILGLLSTAPEWASTMQKKHSPYFDRYYEPKDMEQFTTYARIVAKRYKGTIDAYDVWNEPWLPQFWHAGRDAAKGAGPESYLSSDDPEGHYADLMEAAYKGVRATDKNITVLGFNTSAGFAKWTHAILERGGLRNCDAVCYHHYAGGLAGGPGDIVETGWKQAIGPIADAGKLDKPVWMSEGSPTAGSIGAGFYKHTLPYEDDEDVVDTSNRLCRYIVSLLAQRVEKVFLYSMHCHTYFGPKTDWRALVTEEGYLHPCAAAHSAMAWHLEDCRFASSLALADGVTAYLFEHKDRAVAVLCTRPKHAAYVLPRGKDTEGSDLFGNPLPAGAELGATLVYLTARNLRLLRNTLAGGRP